MKFKYGKYKGLRMSDIAKIDPQYIFWILANTDSFVPLDATVTAHANR